MSVIRMERKASDNEYFHRDFYVTADNGIEYLGQKYGEEKVKEFLAAYAAHYYKDLIAEIKKEGVAALKTYFIRFYTEEKCPDVVMLSQVDKSLTVEITQCPAVTYMKSIDHTPSVWYCETVNTVYATIAKLANLRFELLYYNEENGASKFIFQED